MIPRVPMRRWGEPKDFGGIAVYLASEASAYHSGDSFVIDGGYSIFNVKSCIFLVSALPIRGAPS